MNVRIQHPNDEGPDSTGEETSTLVKIGSTISNRAQNLVKAVTEMAGPASK
jgi:hypothetical protein